MLTLLTASLLFPLVLMMLEPDSTYGWWFMLILFGTGMASVLIPQLLVIVLFNLIVLKAKGTFARAVQYILLGAALGGGCFGIKVVLYFNGNWEVLLQNVLLMTVSGGLFGFYHYWLTRTNRTLVAR